MENTRVNTKKIHSYIQSISQKNMLLLSVVIYCLFFILTFNWYKFYFDPDGVAYMTIARRVASHDFFRSINGLWSPLNNWMAALVSFFTDNYVLIYKGINAFLSVGVIIMTYLNAKRYIQNKAITNLIVIMLPVILLSYTHIQLAGDLLQLFLFLIYFYLLGTNDFFYSVPSNVLAAVIMVLAYLTKSYSLPFFLIQYPGCYFIFSRLQDVKFSRKLLVKPMAIGISVFILLSSLWACCLYFKYHHFMFSAAGTLNYNWLVGRELAVTPGNNLLIPPPYNDSPGSWEDPYLYYNQFVGPFTSVTTFIRTCKLVLTNIKTALSCLLDISFLSYSIIIALLFLVFLKKGKNNLLQVLLLLFTAFIVISGYLLIHVETRYYWPVAILLLIGGGYLLEKYLFPLIQSSFLKVLIAFIFAFSFLFSPIYDLKELKGAGSDVYRASNFLRENHIKGKFAGNYREASLNSWYLELAYLSGSNLYSLRKIDFTQEELLEAIHDTQLDFFIYTFSTQMEKQWFEKGAVASAASGMLQLPNTNKIIVLFNKK